MSYTNRHRDFQRIFSEFCKFLGLQKGEAEYNQWITDYGIDESKPYGACLESLQDWDEETIRLINEDTEAKYYEIIVGLPITSMNGNVYNEHDLAACSATIKGTSPSYRHKDRYWFSDKNPRNHWGKLENIAAKFHNGATKAVLKVPRTATCPDNGLPMTKMIDEKQIINVSLEGNNRDGFEYGEIPYTLLPKDTLPGIPLARIKPLEKIVSEAFQTLQSSNNTRQEKRKMKITLKMKEESDPAAMGKQKNTEDPNVYTTVDAGRSTGPSGQDGGFRGDLVDVSQQTDVAAGVDPAQSKPEGIWQTTQNDDGTAVPHENKEGVTGTPLTISASDKPELIQPGSPMPTVDNHKGPDSNPIGRVLPKAVVDNAVPLQHWGTSTGQMQPSDGTPTKGSYPHESSETLAEKVGRLKAEDNAKSFEQKAVEWEKRYVDASEAGIRKEGQITELKQGVEQANMRMEKAIQDMNTAFLERDKYRDLRDQACGERDETRLKYEKLVTDNKVLAEKYQNQLNTNLSLSNKLTQANEDYLYIHKQLDATKEALERTRIEAKKIIKIKA